VKNPDDIAGTLYRQKVRNCSYYKGV